MPRTVAASFDAGIMMPGCGQFSSLFRLRPTSCAMRRPPPTNRMATYRKISRHCWLLRWRRDTATYQAKASTAQANNRENEQRAGFPAALLIDRFEFIRKRFEEGALQTGFGIAQVDLSKCLAHFVRRNIALCAH